MQYLAMERECKKKKVARWRISWDDESSKAGKAGFYTKIARFQSNLLKE
jgi:hypothetical protein